MSDRSKIHVSNTSYLVDDDSNQRVFVESLLLRMSTQYSSWHLEPGYDIPIVYPPRLVLYWNLEGKGFLLGFCGTVSRAFTEVFAYI